MRHSFLARRACALAVVLVAVCLVVAPRAEQAQAVATPALPALDNAEFWRLTSELSEPDGTFHSENLVSNEARFQTIVPASSSRRWHRPAPMSASGRSRTSPTSLPSSRRTSFILDIRHGNLDLHLLYKAFFEMSADRADFVSRLFARPRPAGLTASSSAAEIFAAYSRVVAEQGSVRSHARGGVHASDATARLRPVGWRS